MLFSLLLAYFAGISPVVALTGRTLERRGPQTSAVCSVDFLWADNSEGVSPCLLAAVVIGACQGGSWYIPALNSTNTYTNPNSTTANVCTCSWLAYNLLAACADCQGFMQAVPNVAPYFQSCQIFETTTNSYFPDNYVLPADTFIPYWATTDPKTWPSQHFDVTTAKNISQQGHPDISSATTSSSKKKKTPIGVIVGISVGGLALVVFAGGTTFLICRRRRTTRPPSSPSVTMEHLTHIRSPSDITMTSIGSLGYATLVSTSTSPQDRRITTHSYNTSPQSPSYFNSPIATIPQPTAPPSNLEQFVDPFISPLGPINISPGDRKGATGRTPVNDALTTSPVRIQSWAEPRRSRLNPPPYSPTDDSPSPSARTQRRHTHQTDTYWTHTSGAQSGSGQAGESGASPFSDILARVPENLPPARERVDGKPNIDSKREKKKGTARSVDRRDIA